MAKYYIQSIMNMILLIRRSCERIKEKDAKNSLFILLKLKLRLKQP